MASVQGPVVKELSLKSCECVEVEEEEEEEEKVVLRGPFPGSLAKC